MSATHANWFITQQVGHGIFLILEPGHVQSFLVCGSKKAVLIDTGMGFADIRPVIRSLTSLPVTVINTHWHFDHIGGNALFNNIGISLHDSASLTRPLSNSLLRSLYIDPCLKDGICLPPEFDPDTYAIQSPEPSFFMADGDVVDLGDRKLYVISTPGHTKGSLSFLDSKTQSLFCGDLVYDGTLYVHFKESDLGQYLDSLERLSGMKNQISQLFTCHNTPVLSPKFIDKGCDLLAAVKEKRTSDKEVMDWGRPVIRHEYKDMAVLTKAPGCPGIDLLGFNLG